MHLTLAFIFNMNRFAVENAKLCFASLDPFLPNGDDCRRGFKVLP